MDSITITQKELKEILAEIGNNLAEKAGKDDMFLSLLFRLYF